MNVRLKKLRAFMARLDLDAVVVNKPENRTYFSGFAGTSALLVVSKDEAKLITDFRYIEQAKQQAKFFDVVEHDQKMLPVAARLISSCKAAKIGIEGDAFTYNEFSMLSGLLPETEIKAVGLDDLRTVKDEAEISLMRRAVEISDAAFARILSVIRPGVTELAVAAELEHCMRLLGSEKPAFETIVASGARGSLPHGLATDKPIAEGELVTMDFGAVYRGYHSDITRTVCVGKADETQRRIYDIVLDAQILGVKAVAPGKSGKRVDEEARRLIVDAGYGKYFGHGLGHGAGLAIHEQPRLSPSSTCERLEENMIVTVEPGIYLPGWGGVRIEDTVLVTKSGAEVLTKSRKELIELQ